MKRCLNCGKTATTTVTVPDLGKFPACAKCAAVEPIAPAHDMPAECPCAQCRASEAEADARVASVRRALSLAPVLPAFGDRLVLIAMTPFGRLYFNTWASHDGSPKPYMITGFGSNRVADRKEAARVLRYATLRYPLITTGTVPRSSTANQPGDRSTPRIAWRRPFAGGTDP